MKNLRAIRKRIASVSASQGITKALRLVSASKLRRAQNAAIRARPLAGAIARVVRDVAMKARTDYPLWAKRPIYVALVLAIGSDRGMCGSFNTSIHKAVVDFLHTHQTRYMKIELATIGHKVQGLVVAEGLQPLHEFADVYQDLTFQKCKEIVQVLVNDYLSAEFDVAFVLYNGFSSVMSRRVSLDRLLPISEPGDVGEREWEADVGKEDFIFEPDALWVLDRLVPRHLAIQVYQALLESLASEHAARMMALDSASDNASQALNRLKMDHNRARQTEITREIVDFAGIREVMASE